MKRHTSSQRVVNRSRLLRQIRKFFYRKGYSEVQTSCLNPYPCIEAHLEVFAVASDDQTIRWLRASPESEMKQILARTEQDIFQIGPVFRMGERGKRHREEFTMLEWYKVDVGWERLLDETLELLYSCRLSIKQTVQMTWLDWIEANYGENLWTLSIESLRLLAVKHHIDPNYSRAELIDYLFDISIRRAQEKGRLYVITHYPRQMAVNAASDPDSEWSTRFECFYRGLEIVNGCAEVCDPDEQMRRFEEQNRLRTQKSKAELDIDRAWLAAMTQLPPCSGAAMGIDRVLMAAGESDTIEDLDPIVGGIDE